MSNPAPADALPGVIAFQIEAARHTTASSEDITRDVLRTLTDWANEVAAYQHTVGNTPTSDKALWMAAVLNPDGENA